MKLPETGWLRDYESLSEIRRSFQQFLDDVRRFLSAVPELQFKTVSVTGGDTEIYLDNPVYPARPSGVFIGKIARVDGSTITSAVSLTWDTSGTQIVLHDLAGLTSDVEYTLTLMVVS